MSATPTTNPHTFSIDANTGVISAELELDREVETAYEIVIEVTGASMNFLGP